MSAISKSLNGVRTRFSLHSDATGPVGLTFGAAAIAVAVATSFASISAAEPGPGVQAAADNAKAAAATTVAPVAQAAPFPAAPAIAPLPAPAPPPPPVYTNDLDGWIRQALDILNARGIPASYDGIHRNILRESSGNPGAINLYDSNAAAGIPSKGLLQVIDPTFAAYHVEGTVFDVWDPVANIVAACNYAADKYGSMDNVNSAY
ncbi:transglycosylase SLT domain-containing protein [Aldersonia kunmingensis]|uniref:transglycosylase SLT domain-containing protein n=1 Tax=Aldersonia kunmingensis TaxID=408066 RepID=UPI00082EFB4D|nr:transglycosylase SLT domain-containing protein [Aldersonia kunmingensis]